jgi:soluble lytic murein transglycosylase-like protein
MINNVQSSNSASGKSSSAKANRADGSFDSTLQSAMSGKSMDKIFSEAAEKYSVPEKLLRAVAETESDYNAKAVSSCGAVGVMQLMPETARSLGVSDPFDAEQNINGGAKYLSNMLKKYSGDIELALAAYNAGPGNVAKYGGVPPFEETTNYIGRIKSILREGSTSGIDNVKTAENAYGSERIGAAGEELSNAEIKKYLAYIQLSMLNRLHESLNSDYDNEEFIAGIRRTGNL